MRQSSLLRDLLSCAIRILPLVLAGVPLVPLVPAQHIESHRHIHSGGNAGRLFPAGTVNGAVGEPIPDTVAYRLFLTAATEHPESKVDEKARQRALLSQARWSEAELHAAAAVLSDYRSALEALAQSFNARVSAGAAQIEDLNTAQASLVAATRLRLAAFLSPASLTGLDRLVQSEKRKMKIVPFPAGMGGGPKP